MSDMNFYALIIFVVLVLVDFVVIELWVHKNKFLEEFQDQLPKMMKWYLWESSALIILLAYFLIKMRCFGC